MSILDGLNMELKNELVELDNEMEFAIESDFEFALEAAIDKKLSSADIEAILNGDDDIPEIDDDTFEEEYGEYADEAYSIYALEAQCKKALEACDDVDFDDDDDDDIDDELDEDEDMDLADYGNPVSDEFDIDDPATESDEGLDLDSFNSDSNISNIKENVRQAFTVKDIDKMIKKLVNAEKTAIDAKTKLKKSSDNTKGWTKLLDKMNSTFKITPSRKIKSYTIDYQPDGSFYIDYTYDDDYILDDHDDTIREKVEAKFTILVNNLQMIRKAFEDAYGKNDANEETADEAFYNIPSFDDIADDLL